MKPVNLGVLIRDIPYQTPYKRVQTHLFNLKTSELEQKYKVLEALGISEEEFYTWDYDYIPLPDISYADTQRDYLITSHIKAAEKILRENPDDGFLEGYFGNVLEFHELSSFWWQHHLSVVKQKAIEWCNDYKIPYTDTCPDIKPIKMVYQRGSDD